MSNDLTALERRASLLAEKLTARKNLLVQSLLPSSQRPPFSKQLSKPAALRFWQQHRFDDIGKKALANMDEASVLELDVALAQANEAEMFGGVEDGLYR